MSEYIPDLPLETIHACPAAHRRCRGRPPSNSYRPHVRSPLGQEVWNQDDVEPATEKRSTSVDSHISYTSIGGLSSVTDDAQPGRCVHPPIGRPQSQKQQNENSLQTLVSVLDDSGDVEARSTLPLNPDCNMDPLSTGDLGLGRQEASETEESPLPEMTSFTLNPRSFCLGLLDRGMSFLQSFPPRQRRLYDMGLTEPSNKVQKTDKATDTVEEAYQDKKKKGLDGQVE